MRNGRGGEKIRKKEEERKIREKTKRKWMNERSVDEKTDLFFWFPIWDEILNTNHKKYIQYSTNDVKTQFYLAISCFNTLSLGRGKEGKKKRYKEKIEGEK